MLITRSIYYVCVYDYIFSMNTLKTNGTQMMKLEVYFPFMYWKWLNWIPEKVSRMLTEIHRSVTLRHSYPMNKLTIVVVMGSYFEENSNFG